MTDPREASGVSPNRGNENPVQERLRRLLLITWVVLVLIPIGGGFSILDRILTHEEKERRDKKMALMQEEMRSFRKDLELEQYFARTFDRLSRKYGFEESEKGFDAPVFQGIGRRLVNNLLRDIRRAFRTRVHALFVTRADGGGNFVYLDPRHFPKPRLSRQEVRDFMTAEFVLYDKVPVGDGTWLASAHERWKQPGNPAVEGQDSLVRKLFGQFVKPDLRDRWCDDFFSPLFGGTRLLIYKDDRVLPVMHAQTQFYGGFIAVLLEEELDPIVRLRWSKGNSFHPGFKRSFVRGGSFSRPRTIERSGRVLQLAPFPQEATPSKWRKQIGRSGGARDLPVLVVSFPVSDLKHPFRKFMPLLKLLAAGLLLSTLYLAHRGFREISPRNAHLRDPQERGGTGFPLERKIILAVASGTVVPLVGFLLSGTWGVVLKSRINPQEVMNHLEFRLSCFNQGCSGFETFWVQTLHRLRLSLQKRVDEPFRRFLEARNGWIAGLRHPRFRNQLRIAPIEHTLLRYSGGGLEEDAKVDSGGEKESIRKAANRSLPLEWLFLTGGLQGLRSGELRKASLGIEAFHILTEQIFGMSTMGKLLMHDMALFVHPVKGDFRKTAIVPIFGNPRQPPRGVFFTTLEDGQITGAFLRGQIFSKGPLREEFGGYRIDYAFFQMRTSAGLGNETLADPLNPKGIIHQLAQTSCRTESQIRQFGDEVDSDALTATRFLLPSNFLGIARATPIRGTELNLAAILWTLGAYTGFMVVFISWLLARVLTGPVNDLTMGVRAIGTGNLDVRIVPSSSDELGDLGAAFNGMIQGLAERKRMARFVSREVLEAVSGKDESRLQPGGETVEVTVLFSHIRGFGALAREHSGERIVSLLNEFFTAMEPAITGAGGSIDKFIGDAVMAVFREGGRGEAHSVMACRAALAMKEALGAMNERRRAAGDFPVEIGIGIAGGPVISGRIGSRKGRLDYTVIGNAVNLAARLESESHRAGETGILVSPGTIRFLKGAAVVGFVDRIAIKGRTNRTFPLYQLLSMRERT